MFEYVEVQVGRSDGYGGTRVNIDLLNQWGSEGWELCTIQQHTWAVMKRLKQPSGKEWWKH